MNESGMSEQSAWSATTCCRFGNPRLVASGEGAKASVEKAVTSPCTPDCHPLTPDEGMTYRGRMNTFFANQARTQMTPRRKLMERKAVIVAIRRGRGILRRLGRDADCESRRKERDLEESKFKSRP